MGGLPHSEIPGSKLTGSSPGLFAACHVLHRLSMPRHPPNALQTLDLATTRRDQKTEVRDRMSDVRQQISEIRPTSPRLAAPLQGGTGTNRDRQKTCMSAEENSTPPTAQRAANGAPSSSFLFTMTKNRSSDLRFQGAISWPAARSSKSVGWWSRSGSNRRPPACKAGALPAELRPPRARQSLFLIPDI